MPLVDVLDSGDLADSVPRVVTVAGRDIVLFRIGDDVHAVDDECPHDGTRLSAGELAGVEIRTARGARFDLTTGVCVRGGEDVRRYHARLEAGRVLVQVDVPLAEMEQAGIVASLRSAMLEADVPRIARECVRLLATGAEGVDIIRAATRFGSERGSGGFTGALGACSDFARIAPLFPGKEQAFALVQAVIGVALANRGRSQRPIPEQAKGVLAGTADARRAKFVDLIERRDGDGAEAMLSGALYQGMAVSEASQWLMEAASRHVVDGGLPFIHAQKAIELCESLGSREALFLLPPLVPPLVYGVREDGQPFFAEAARLLSRTDEVLANMMEREQPASSPEFDDRNIRAALLDGSAAGAFDATFGALSAGVSARRVALSVALAGAERILRFDDLREWDESIDVTWSDAVRPFLHAVATMKAARRWASASTLRSVLVSALLVQRARPLDLPEHRRPANRPLPASRHRDEAINAVLASVRARIPGEALSLTKGYFDRTHDGWRLVEALARFSVEDDLPTQELVERASAVVVAAADTWEEAAGHPDAALAVHAAVKLLSSQTRQRWNGRHVARMLARLG